MDTIEYCTGSAATLLRLAASTGDVWQADFASGKLSHSSALLRRLGYEPGEIGDTGDSWLALVHPDDRESLCNAWQEHLKRGVSYDVVYRARMKCGEYRWFNSRGQATWDVDGRATMMAGVIHDITSKLAAEDCAREGKEGFQKVFQLSPVPTALTVLDNARILDVNHAFQEFFGFSREQLLGRTALQLGIHVDGTARAALAARLRSEGRIRDAELPVRIASGEIRNVMVSADAVTFVGDACALVTFRDVTDRKRYEERLEYVATHDELTGLPNRTLIRDRLSQGL